jgi:hypothetical protein
VAYSLTVNYLHPSGRAVGQTGDGTPMLWVNGTPSEMGSPGLTLTRCNGIGTVVGYVYDNGYRAVLGEPSGRGRGRPGLCF